MEKYIIKNLSKNPIRTKLESIYQTSASLNLLALQILSKSSPLEAYSISIARWVGVRTTNKFTLFFKFLNLN